MKDNNKELAKTKRQCDEIAGKIHDIVEETLWTDYDLLPELSYALIEKIQDYKSLQNGNA